MLKGDLITSSCASTVVALTTALVVTTSTIDDVPLPLINHRLNINSPICSQLGNSIEGVTISPGIHGFFSETEELLNPIENSYVESEVDIYFPPTSSYSLRARIVSINKPGPIAYNIEASGLIV
jgi:hypothetical protein